MSCDEVKTTSQAIVRKVVLKIQSSEGHEKRTTVQTKRDRHCELNAT